MVNMVCGGCCFQSQWSAAANGTPLPRWLVLRSASCLPKRLWNTTNRLHRLTWPFLSRGLVDAVGRLGSTRSQANVIYEFRRAIWAQDVGFPGHVQIDVRMVMGRVRTDAVEFRRSDSDHGRPDIVGVSRQIHNRDRRRAGFRRAWFRGKAATLIFPSLEGTLQLALPTRAPHEQDKMTGQHSLPRT
jgi:hypothetical protein